MATNVWSVSTNPEVSSWADHVQEEAEACTLNDPHASPEFPSLGEALKQAPKQKKKTVQKLNLGEFLSTGKSVSAPLKANDKDILASLPSGPRSSSRDEVHDSRFFRGGFKDYGGVSDRPERRERDDAYMPSRADEASDWGAARKFAPSSGPPPGFSGGGGFGERRGGFASDRAPSYADSAEDYWGGSRTLEPSSGRDRNAFRRPFEGREPSAADEDQYDSRRVEPGAARGDVDERPRLKLQPRSAPVSGGSNDGGVSSEQLPSSQQAPSQPKKPSPFGAARPREEVLREKGIDYRQEELRLEHHTFAAFEPSVATSSVSAVSSSSGSERQVTLGQSQRPKVNPFGAARPREEVLKEKGVDYHKEELKLEHGDVLRDETPAEATMKEEVEELRRKLQLIKATPPDQGSAADEVATAAAELDAKEKQLYRLQAELDDRVRFARPPPPRGRPSGEYNIQTAGRQYGDYRQYRDQVAFQDTYAAGRSLRSYREYDERPRYLGDGQSAKYRDYRDRGTAEHVAYGSQSGEYRDERYGGSLQGAYQPYRRSGEYRQY